MVCVFVLQPRRPCEPQLNSGLELYLTQAKRAALCTQALNKEPLASAQRAVASLHILSQINPVLTLYSFRSIVMLVCSILLLPSAHSPLKLRAICSVWMSNVKLSTKPQADVTS
jgi:hypothetical protein